MTFESLRELIKPPWFDLIRTLKRVPNRSLQELSDDLGMTPPALKKHCQALEDLGYLSLGKRLGDGARSVNTYRLTEKADGLFPEAGSEVLNSLIKATELQFGSNAPEKLMFGYFQEMTAHYQRKMKSATSVADRASILAKLRDETGHVSTCSYDPKLGLRIIEQHNPLQSIFEKYPTLERMEQIMFERVLGRPVRRHSERSQGGRHIVFEIETL